MPVKIISVAHPLYASVLQLRDDVLRKPLGLSINDDDLGDEVHQTIFIKEEGDLLKGCLLLKQLNADTVKLRQMAVDNTFQGQGIGRELMDAALLFATQSGIRNIELNARQYAADFYLKCGYTIEGEVFEEVGIPHVRMVRKLEHTP